MNSQNISKQNNYIRIGITIWMVLQLPRLIALPLITSILGGVDSPVWMYPAILDIVVVVATPLVLFLLWKRPQLSSWVLAIVYFCVSIVDHGGAVTASILASTPVIFEQFGENGHIAPMIQTIFDVIAIWFLSKKSFRALYIH